MYKFILAQIIGIIIIIVNVYHDLQDDRRKILLSNTLINILCTIQYFLLGALTGAICCLIAALRSYIFSKFKKNTPFIIFLIYSIIVILLNYRYINNIIDVIPVLNVIIFAYAISREKVYNIKVSLIIIGLLGSIYDFKNKAFTGMIINITDFTSGVFGVIKLKKKKRKSKR